MVARRPITSARQDPGLNPNLVAPQVAISGGVNELVQAGQEVANTLDFFYQKLQKEENTGFNDELEARYGIAADEIVRGSRSNTLNKDYAQTLTASLSGMRAGLIEELRQKYRVNSDGMNLANRNTFKLVAASTRKAATQAFNSRLKFHNDQKKEKLQSIYKRIAMGDLDIEANLTAARSINGTLSGITTPGRTRSANRVSQSEIVEQTVERLVRDGNYAGAREVRKKYIDHIDIDKFENLENTIAAGEKSALTAGIKQIKAQNKSIAPDGAAAPTDPVTVFSKTSNEVLRQSQRFGNAFIGGQEDDDATTDVEFKDELRMAVDVAGDKLWEELGGLGISPAYRKLLPKRVAATMARQLETMKPEQVWGQMEKLRLAAGKHWPQIWKEMQQQGLKSGMVLTGMAETPEQMIDVAVATRMDIKEVGATLPPEDVNAVKKKVLTESQEFFNTFGRGGLNGPQVRSFSYGLQKLAVYYLSKGDTQEDAVKKATALINDQFDFIEGPNISVMLPTKYNISEADLENVLDDYKTYENLKKFNPMRVHKDTYGSLEQSQVITNAMSLGVWRSNAQNDGVILMNRLQGGTLNVVRDEDGNYFGLKYEDIPLMVKELEPGIEGDS